MKLKVLEKSIMIYESIIFKEYCLKKYYEPVALQKGAFDSFDTILQEGVYLTHSTRSPCIELVSKRLDKKFLQNKLANNDHIDQAILM